MAPMVAQLGVVLDDASAGTVAIGDRRVRRLGFGAMRVSQARDAQGLVDRSLALELVLGVRDRGVQFFDTANIYGWGQRGDSGSGTGALRGGRARRHQGGFPAGYR